MFIDGVICGEHRHFLVVSLHKRCVGNQRPFASEKPRSGVLGITGRMIGAKFGDPRLTVL